MTRRGLGIGWIHFLGKHLVRIWRINKGTDVGEEQRAHREVSVDDTKRLHFTVQQIEVELGLGRFNRFVNVV